VSNDDRKTAPSGRLLSQRFQSSVNCIPLVMPNLEACSEPFQISVTVRKMLVAVLLSLCARIQPLDLWRLHSLSFQP
jgi:hypothetical protein